MRTMPGVTTRSLEEPIECSRMLLVMGCAPRMEVARKWNQVNQYTNEPPTLGCIVQQDRRTERNPMLMGDGRMEWNEHVNVTVRVYHSSMNDLSLSFLGYFNIKLPAMRSILANICRFYHEEILLCDSYRHPFQTGTERTKPIYNCSSL